MNYRRVCNIIGKIMLCISVLMLVPVIVAIIFGEYNKIIYFIIPILISATAGFILQIKKAKHINIYAREGFVIVALTWIIISLLGALPFFLSGEIPSYIDAFFETVSGFTTAGSSILNEVESMSYCLLFWRCFTHWIGGMGILTFVMIFIKGKNGNFMHIMRAETSGPVVTKSVAKIDLTARFSYIIYFVLTIIEAVLLVIVKIPVFDSITIALSTAGTGGFTVKNLSIAAYNNPAAEVICSIFMIIFGISFGLIFLMCSKKFKAVLKNSELKAYLAIVLVSIGLVTWQISAIYNNFADSLRHALFNVASIISTTGFVTVDYNIWPSSAILILVLLMLIGGCSGSTAGGTKVFRSVTAVKDFWVKIRRMINPNSVKSVKINGKSIDRNLTDVVYVYFVASVLVMGLSILVMTFFGYDITTSSTAVITCFNNVGPGVGNIVGPKQSFASINDVCKILLSIDMLIGRLEIFPILILFMPRTWRKVA